MLKVTSRPITTWTATDLVDRFGPIPLSRICFEPPPGHAVEDHVLEIRNQHRRLFELVEGTLVEKAMGYLESVIAYEIGSALRVFATEHKLGIVAGEAGLIQLELGLVRIPDVSFIRWDSLPQQSFPEGSFLEQAPDLAVEVISPSNTLKEMEAKLQEYFAKGTRLVWYVYPRQREVHVFHSTTEVTILDQSSKLSGGEVLPGFELPVKNVFASLKNPESE